jgi:hypothetical protein
MNRSVVGSFTDTRLNVKLAQCFIFDFVCSCVPRFMNQLSAWNSWFRRSVRRNTWAKSTRLLIHQPQDQPAKCFELYFVWLVVDLWRLNRSVVGLSSKSAKVESFCISSIREGQSHLLIRLPHRAVKIELICSKFIFSPPHLTGLTSW